MYTDAQTYTADARISSMSEHALPFVSSVLAASLLHESNWPANDGGRGGGGDRSVVTHMIQLSYITCNCCNTLAVRQVHPTD